MASIDIEQQLRAHFGRSLPMGADRRIVIWHDESGEFEEDFDGLASRDALGSASDRPVRYLKVQDGNYFTTKLLINKEDTSSDLLIYRQQASGNLAGDWLADVELYAESFQADFLSMLVEELGAQDTTEVRNNLGRYKKFFAAQDRKKRFMELVPYATKGSDVVIGMLATLLGVREPRSEEIIRAFALELVQLDGSHGDGVPSDSRLAQLQRFDLEDAMRRYLQRVTGYEGDLYSYTTFMDHLLLSAFAETVADDQLKGLDGKYSPMCSMFCLNIVHDWMEADDAEREVLFEAARGVEARNNLVLRFSEAKPEALVRSDIFPLLDEVLLKGVLEAIAQGTDCQKDATAILETRRDFLWARSVGDFYSFAEAALAMKCFHDEHTDGFHCTSAKEAFDAYTDDWWRMDLSYRKFCEAYQRCVAADNVTLVDATESLMTWGNNLYTNWFLVGVNDCWIAAAAPAWETSGYVPDVPLQRMFFADAVKPQLSKVKRVAVIVSDALRYAVGCQLKETLERKTRNELSLTAMQATFPSITSFGMAALLPHYSMTFEPDGAVLVDGMKTASTEQRQMVLDKELPGSRAIQANKLFEMTASERKEFMQNAPVTYIYHNTIDAAGEKKPTERKVFEACEQAVEEVFQLVKMLTGSLGFSRVVVTADHGFLYTDRPLPESERISSLEVGTDTWMIAERFAIVDEDPESTLFTKMNMKMVSDGDAIGLAPRGFAFIKRPGGGNYAHGGVSLQEVCVPVLHIKSASGKADDANYAQDAQLLLLDTNRRITSMLFNVKLYQPEAISGKVAPCKYEFEFVDGSGNVVSDVRHATADREAEATNERQFDLRFSLKEGIPYKSSDAYYLIARKEDTGEQVWREEYSIDIAFAPAEDFGF